MILHWSFRDGGKLLAWLTSQAGRGGASQRVGTNHDTLGPTVAVDRVGLPVGGEGGLATHYRLQVDYICRGDSTGVYHGGRSVWGTCPCFCTDQAGPLFWKSNKFVTGVVKACVNPMLKICWCRNLHLLFLLGKHFAQAVAFVAREF